MTPFRWRGVKGIIAKALKLPVTGVCGDSGLKEPLDIAAALPDPESTLPVDHPLVSRRREKASLPEGILLSGRFRIGGLIGEGGMGEVYRARDEELRENVALKIISRAVANREEIVDGFYLEVQRARRITHPNVCRVHDLFFHAMPDGSTLRFLTMQLINGPTLTEIIRRPRPAPLLQALALLDDLMAGIGAAHEVGIAHGDLKPNNVLLDQPEGQRPRAVITDFGLARALHQNAGTFNPTEQCDSIQARCPAST